MRRFAEPLIVVLAALAVAGVGWAMMNTGYDTWGAFVLVPLMIAVSIPILRRTFRNHDPWLYRLALAGLVTKFLGSLVRYHIAYNVYGGSDATGYHFAGRDIARAVRDGSMSPFDAIPYGVGTVFLQRTTGVIYTLIGTSRLAGFMFFAWMAYWGALWFFRAAALAVPGLSQRRYALLIFFAPSMVYWPTSIGKEAWMSACLGAASYAGARIITGNGSFGAFLLGAAGLTLAGFVRPHFSAIWLGSLVVALVVGALTGRTGKGARRKFVTLLFAAAAVAGLSAAASLTIRYLAPPNGGDGSDTTEESAEVTDQISSIFDETTRRSEQGGSGFQPITLSGPQVWPYAIVRTLTRPMLYEARSFAELIPAVEMAALMGIGVVWWRRLVNVPRMLLRSPYLVFALTVLLMFGLAFTTIGNLGILTRQRSLIMPLFLVFFCVPRRRRRKVTERPALTMGARSSDLVSVGR